MPAAAARLAAIRSYGEPGSASSSAVSIDRHVSQKSSPNGVKWMLRRTVWERLAWRIAPGMLLDAARDRGIDLERSVMVGDRWRDVEAGRRAGCKTVFIDSGYSERSPEAPDLIVGQLDEAVPWVLRNHRKNARQ